MEIKLNQYTLPLMCSLVSAFTYAIIFYTNDRLNRTSTDSEKRKKQRKKDEDHKEHEECQSDKLSAKPWAKKRKDSLYLAKLKRRTSNEEEEFTVEDYNDDKGENESSFDDHEKDEYDSDDPAGFLQSRIQRSEQNNRAAGERRGTIAFADELQATLGDHFKTLADSSEEKKKKSGCQDIHCNYKNTQITNGDGMLNDMKPILKQLPGSDTLEGMNGSRRSSRTAKDLLDVIMASPFASKDGSRRSSLNEDDDPYAITKFGTKVNKVSSSAKQLQEILKTPTYTETISPTNLEATFSNIVINVHPPDDVNNSQDGNQESLKGANHEDVLSVDSAKLQRTIKEYDQCMQELRAYKSHVVALQEDLEELEKENNTLRLITEKSEQGRRMSILITENEALFQSNCTLCQQLDDLEQDIEENETHDGIAVDIEKTTLKRQVDALYKQNTNLDKQLRQLKEDVSEESKEYINTKKEKESLDDKILEFTDLLSEAEERARNLEKENGKLKKSIEHIKTENTKCKALQISTKCTYKDELASKEAKFKETLQAKDTLEQTLTILQKKIKDNEKNEQSNLAYIDKLKEDLVQERTLNKNFRVKIQQYTDQLEEKTERLDTSSRELTSQLSKMDHIKSKFLEANNLSFSLREELNRNNGKHKTTESNGNSHYESSNSDVSSENGVDRVDSPGSSVVVSDYLPKLNATNYLEKTIEEDLEELKHGNDEAKIIITNLQGIIQSALGEFQ